MAVSYFFQVCLNWSAAAFKSAVSSLLNAFSFAILAMRSVFLVVKKSVQLAWNSLIRSTGTSST